MILIVKVLSDNISYVLVTPCLPVVYHEYMKQFPWYKVCYNDLTSMVLVIIIRLQHYLLHVSSNRTHGLPCHNAAGYGYLEVVKLLVANGASLQLSDKVIVTESISMHCIL